MNISAAAPNITSVPRRRYDNHKLGWPCLNLRSDAATRIPTCCASQHPGGSAEPPARSGDSFADLQCLNFNASAFNSLNERHSALSARYRDVTFSWRAVVQLLEEAGRWNIAYPTSARSTSRGGALETPRLVSNPIVTVKLVADAVAISNGRRAGA